MHALKKKKDYDLEKPFKCLKKKQKTKTCVDIFQHNLFIMSYDH